MCWIVSNFNTSSHGYRKRSRRGFIYLLWASALAIVLCVIAGTCSPRFEHWWESLVVLNQL